MAVPTRARAPLRATIDPKPENLLLLLDSDGYVTVVDFGFATVVTTCACTLCGTPEYLVLLGDDFKMMAARTATL